MRIPILIPLVNTCLFLSMFFSHIVSAETLILKDGSEIKGTIVEIRSAENEIVLKSDSGRIYTFKQQEIKTYRTEQSQYSAAELDLEKNRVVEPITVKPPHRFGVTLTHSSVDYYLYRDASNKESEAKTELNGFDIAIIYFFNNYIGFEAATYWGETDNVTFGSGRDNFKRDLARYTEFESLSTMGGRSALVAGWNIRDSGFRVYIGAGVYAERTKLKRTNQSEITDHIIGTAIKFGLRYNWSAISLDFWGSTRSNQAYGFNDGSSQGGLSMSYRF